MTVCCDYSPIKDTVVVNDRWGRGCRCQHGGVFTGRDRYNPGKSKYFFLLVICWRRPWGRTRKRASGEKRGRRIEGKRKVRLPRLHTAFLMLFDSLYQWHIEPPCYEIRGCADLGFSSERVELTLRLRTPACSRTTRRTIVHAFRETYTKSRRSRKIITIKKYF